MTDASWTDNNRVVSAHPGPRDSFVITLVDGKRASVEPVDAYEQALNRATMLARQIRRPVKLLPMQAAELIGLMGLKAGDMTTPSADDAEARQLVVNTCREAILESNDAFVRREAHCVLAGMGETL